MIDLVLCDHPPGWFGGVRYYRASQGLVTIARWEPYCTGFKRVGLRWHESHKTRPIGLELWLLAAASGVGARVLGLSFPRRYTGAHDSVRRRSGRSAGQHAWRAPQWLATDFPRHGPHGRRYGQPHWLSDRAIHVINAVYIGHPGWKAMGGRSAILRHGRDRPRVGVVWYYFSDAVALIPVVEQFHPFCFIGMLIGAQAFQETPQESCASDHLAFTPHLAALGKLQIDNALGAAGTSAVAIGFDQLGRRGCSSRARSSWVAVSILGGLVLGAVAVFIIDHLQVHERQPGFALTGAAVDLSRFHAR